MFAGSQSVSEADVRERSCASIRASAVGGGETEAATEAGGASEEASRGRLAEGVAVVDMYCAESAEVVALVDVEVGCGKADDADDAALLVEESAVRESAVRESAAVRGGSISTVVLGDDVLATRSRM